MIFHKKFRIGERVMHRITNQEGVVIETRRTTKYGYKVQWDNSPNGGGWYVANVLMKLGGPTSE